MGTWVGADTTRDAGTARDLTTGCLKRQRRSGKPKRRNKLVAEKRSDFVNCVGVWVCGWAGKSATLHNLASAIFVTRILICI